MAEIPAATKPTHTEKPPPSSAARRTKRDIAGQVEGAATGGSGGVFGAGAGIMAGRGPGRPESRERRTTTGNAESPKTGRIRRKPYTQAEHHLPRRHKGFVSLDVLSRPS